MEDTANLPLGMEDLTKKSLSNNRYISLRIFCAELFGTGLFLYFGSAATAQVIIGRDRHNRTSGSGAPTPATPADFDYGDVSTVSLAYGMGLTLAVVACGAVSGSHLNPAVTLTEVFFRRLPATVLPVYLIAQFFGVFIGSGFVHTVHSYKLQQLVKADVGVESVYFTRPTLGVGYDELALAWDQALGSAIYMFVYLSMDDRYTGIKSKPLRAIVIGASYSLLIMSTGINAASALNPVRDFVPRIFAYLVGHNSAFGKFTFIPLLMPFLGCFLGGVVYEACVRSLRQEEEMVEELTTMDDILQILADVERHMRQYRSGLMTDTFASTMTTTGGDDETTETSTERGEGEGEEEGGKRRGRGGGGGGGGRKTSGTSSAPHPAATEGGTPTPVSKEARLPSSLAGELESGFASEESEAVLHSETAAVRYDRRSNSSSSSGTTTPKDRRVDKTGEVSQGEERHREHRTSS